MEPIHPRARPELHALPEISETLWNWPNAVTLGRTALGLGIFCVAAVEQSVAWNFAGLALHWALDALDGHLARRLSQETRLGAQLDILADRLLIAFFLLNHLALHPGAALPVALFLFEFLLLDHYLSNQFMRWPILSPNYFHRVDEWIWRLNWSVPAKILNSSLVALLLLAFASPWPAVAALACLIAVKTYSFSRLRALPGADAWLAPGAARRARSADAASAPPIPRLRALPDPR